MGRGARWGIVGTGSIARKFAEGLKAIPGAELVAVGSRAKDTAEKFAKDFGAAHAHSTYEDLSRDPDVEVVYIATPHPMHRENAILCLNGGKAVLCEKPFAMNTREAEEMLALARRKKLFLMEAMWTHAFPAMAKVRELVSGGAIGEVRMVHADFCFRAGWNPEGRLLNPELGGGALLDVGVYTVGFATMVFGAEPSRIASMSHLGETGVDEQSAMLLGYDGGAFAVLTCAVRTSTPHTAAVFGTDGWIEVPHLFWQPDRIVLHAGDKHEEMAFQRLGNGYSFEAAEVMRCLEAGLLESEIVPHSRTLTVMRTMDGVRAQWGLKYRMEK